MKKVDYTEYEAKFYPVNKELYREKLKSILINFETGKRKKHELVVEGNSV